MGFISILFFSTYSTGKKGPSTFAPVWKSLLYLIISILNQQRYQTTSHIFLIWYNQLWVFYVCLKHIFPSFSFYISWTYHLHLQFVPCKLLFFVWTSILWKPADLILHFSSGQAVIESWSTRIFLQRNHIFGWTIYLVVMCLDLVTLLWLTGWKLLHNIVWLDFVQKYLKHIKTTHIPTTVLNILSISLAIIKFE